MNTLIEKNSYITAQNKASRKNKIPYSHILAYGAPGVGKTLFAKQLARKSKMHFMYFSVSDLAQQTEEKALQTLQDLFLYAKRYAPVVLIVDEADRLFAGGDEKAKKLGTLFQKEFSSSTNPHIQLFLITNYPHQLPLPILNRIAPAHRILFEKPTFKTQKKLFDHHLERAFLAHGKKGKKHLTNIKDMVASLTHDQLKTLVGRDIQAIAADTALNIIWEKTTNYQQMLHKAISDAKKADLEMKNFRLEKSPATKTPEPKTKEPPGHWISAP